MENIQKEKEIDFQQRLDSLYEEIEKLKKEIKDEGGYVEYGTVYMEDYMYVAEIYTYERTKYENYGYTEIHRNMIPIDAEMVTTIKAITQTKDEDIIYGFFFNVILGDFGEYVGNCVEKLDESNIYITVPEDNRYDNTGDFLVEYSYMNSAGQPEDMYFSFYKISMDDYKKFENINLSYKKVLTDN